MGSSESAILIFGWVLACAWSGVSKVTDDFGADINRDIYIKWVLILRSSSGMFTADAHTVIISVTNPLNWFCRPWHVSYVETEKLW